MDSFASRVMAASPGLIAAAVGLALAAVALIVVLVMLFVFIFPSTSSSSSSPSDTILFPTAGTDYFIVRQFEILQPLYISNNNLVVNNLSTEPYPGFESRWTFVDLGLPEPSIPSQRLFSIESSANPNMCLGVAGTDVVMVAKDTTSPGQQWLLTFVSQSGGNSVQNIQNQQTGTSLQPSLDLQPQLVLSATVLTNPLQQWKINDAGVDPNPPPDGGFPSSVLPTPVRIYGLDKQQWMNETAGTATFTLSSTSISAIWTLTFLSAGDTPWERIYTVQAPSGDFLDASSATTVAIDAATGLPDSAKWSFMLISGNISSDPENTSRFMLRNLAYPTQSLNAVLTDLTANLSSNSLSDPQLWDIYINV